MSNHHRLKLQSTASRAILILIKDYDDVRFHGYIQLKCDEFFDLRFDGISCYSVVTSMMAFVWTPGV